MSYRLDFHSTPKILLAHWFEDRKFEINHDINPMLIEITYTLQGNAYAAAGGQALEKVPPNSVLVEVFDEPNYMVCDEYFQHISILFQCQYSRVENGGVAMPRILTFENAANPVHELVDDLVRNHASRPESPLATANLLELIGKLSAMSCKEQGFEQKYGKQWHVYKAKAYINGNLQKQIRISDIAAHLKVSEGYLSHVFKDIEGITIISYINIKRIRRIEQLVLLEGMDIKQAGLQVGLSDPAYISRLFRKILGYSITELRQANQKIKWGSAANNQDNKEN